MALSRVVILSAHGVQQGGRSNEHLPDQDPAGLRRSREAVLAARTAAELANSANSELHLISVPDSTYHSLDWRFEYATYEEAIETVTGETQKVLDEQVQKVQEAGGKVKETHPRIDRYRPDAAIITLTEVLGVGLIVMRSRAQEGEVPRHCC